MVRDKTAYLRWIDGGKSWICSQDLITWVVYIVGYFSDLEFGYVMVCESCS